MYILYAFLFFVGILSQGHAASLTLQLPADEVAALNAARGGDYSMLTNSDGTNRYNGLEFYNADGVGNAYYFFSPQVAGYGAPPDQGGPNVLGSNGQPPSFSYDSTTGTLSYDDHGSGYTAYGQTQESTNTYAGIPYTDLASQYGCTADFSSCDPSHAFSTTGIPTPGQMLLAGAQNIVAAFGSPAPAPTGDPLAAFGSGSHPSGSGAVAGPDIKALLVSAGITPAHVGIGLAAIFAVGLCVMAGHRAFLKVGQAIYLSAPAKAARQRTNEASIRAAADKTMATRERKRAVDAEVTRRDAVEGNRRRRERDRAQSNESAIESWKKRHARSGTTSSGHRPDAHMAAWESEKARRAESKLMDEFDRQVS